MSDALIRRCRARRVLAWTLLLFALGELAAGVMLDMGRAELRDPEFGWRLRILRERLAESPGRRLILALGSSRTEMGFSPHGFQSAPLTATHPPLVFNFGMTGAGPLSELIFLERLLQAGIRPDFLFVEILPPSLGTGELEADLLAKRRLDHADLRLLAGYHPAPSTLLVSWLGTWLVPCASFRNPLLLWTIPSWVPETTKLSYAFQDHQDSLGWVRACADEVSPQEYARLLQHAGEQYRAVLSDFHLSEASTRALRDLLSRCDRRRLPVALLLMPEGSDFRAFYPATTRQTIHAYLDQLTSEYQVPLVDARQWMPDGNFWDSHHLLPPGARAFSERFAREAIEPFVHGNLLPATRTARAP